MPALLDRLRARGWRMTAQRRVIATVMAGEHVHLAADEVHRRARVVLPEISLATVYNTLHELVDLGEVREVTHADGRKRYDTNVAAHHHLECLSCGVMRDVVAQDPRLPPDQARDFEVLHVDVRFRGHCNDCAAAA